ncbi:MAG: cytochrome b5 domain-containing protein [Patescibacteria group bacterium]
MHEILIKIDRFAAWTLFIGVILYFITGYGMTKGIIDSQLSQTLHSTVLTYIILIAFLIHAPWAIHLALKRWQVWNIFTQILLVLLFIGFCGFVVYADQVYSIQPEEDEKEPIFIETETPLKNENINANLNTNKNKENVFTVEELGKYNGQNGQSAYVAVDGNVYDLSSIFQQGLHFSHFAGKDLTNEFYSRHAKSALQGYPIVGTLTK